MSTTKLTADIVAAYLDSNRLNAAEIPDLIRQVHRTVSALGQETPEIAAELPRPTAAQIRRSITPDALVSFLDGRSYKMLKRHLAAHGLTPEEYRRRYGLPANYPMTAPAHSARRSAVAKASGLGMADRKSGRKRIT